MKIITINQLINETIGQVITIPSSDRLGIKIDQETRIYF